MNIKLIEKICKVFNEGQDSGKASIVEYHALSIDYDYTYTALKVTLKEHGYIAIDIDDDFAIHGFLISREYGFFEALAEKHSEVYFPIFPAMCKSVAGWMSFQFAYAIDKDKWLEENL